MQHPNFTSSRRRVLAVIRDKGVVHELFAEIGPHYATRPGGYTRIIKAGFRYGDNAPVAVIEFVDRDVNEKGKDSGPKQVKEEAPAEAAA